MDERFIIVQTDDHDLYFQCDDGDTAKKVFSALNTIMYRHCNGKTPGTLRGMHMAADPEGADPMTPDISKEVFGVVITSDLRDSNELKV